MLLVYDLVYRTELRTVWVVPVKSDLLYPAVHEVDSKESDNTDVHTRAIELNTGVEDMPSDIKQAESDVVACCRCVEENEEKNMEKEIEQLEKKGVDEDSRKELDKTISDIVVEESQSKVVCETQCSGLILQGESKNEAELEHQATKSNHMPEDSEKLIDLKNVIGGKKRKIRMPETSGCRI
ncbi:hypothetical protein J5N97_024765 [Dioscorea zingiberensis]|uniref:Uncharacterized protein n=1 Tax=Dioscorea zingiberensis TaxID=325984 RepID=A0A9D5H9D0_9LILI|nr:hypothetical protein J5N97_024765 [Dioscorea zingiberensis]